MTWKLILYLSLWKSRGYQFFLHLTSESTSLQFIMGWCLNELLQHFAKIFNFKNNSNTGFYFSTIKISLSFIQKAKKKLSRSPKSSQRKKKHCWDCRLQTLCTFKKLARRLKLQFVTNSLLSETTLVKEIFSIKDSNIFFPSFFPEKKFFHKISWHWMHFFEKRIYFVFGWKRFSFMFLFVCRCCNWTRISKISRFLL